MGNSSPLHIILVSVFIILASLKIKEKCYYCFLGLLVLAIVFFIFGIYKFWIQHNGKKKIK